MCSPTTSQQLATKDNQTTISDSDDFPKNNDTKSKVKQPLCGSSETFGLLLLVVVAIVFSVMGCFLKLAGSSGMPSTELVFFRVLFQGAFIVLFMCFWTIPITTEEDDDEDGTMIGGDDGIRTKKKKKTVLLIHQPFGATPEMRNVLILRGILGGLGFIMFYYTIKALPLGDAISLMTLYPVVTVFAARIFLGESLRPSHIFAAAISGIGVILIARPRFIFGYSDNDKDGENSNTNNGTVDPLGYFTAMLGCCFMSSVFITVRKAGKMGAHTLQLLFSFVTFGLIFSIIFSLVISDADDTKWAFPSSSTSWWYVTGMCVSGTVAHVMFNHAAKIAPSGIASVVKSSEAMWSYILQIVVFGQVPKVSTVIGVILIASSVAIVAVQKVYEEKKKVTLSTVEQEQRARLLQREERTKDESYGSMCTDTTKEIEV
mmetsp:Transcript_24165/g.35453  ORF Transcript_24165/g.35453 Transcript_24165/m.35453 type:complete len:431 (+) Transcript_24165:64-1356(+)